MRARRQNRPGHFVSRVRRDSPLAKSVETVCQQSWLTNCPDRSTNFVVAGEFGHFVVESGSGHFMFEGESGHFVVEGVSGHFVVEMGLRLSWSSVGLDIS